MINYIKKIEIVVDNMKVYKYSSKHRYKWIPKQTCR